MYRMFPRRVPSVGVFLAAAIFWLATLGPPISRGDTVHPLDAAFLESTMLAANFVVGEDGTTDATPANGSLHRSVEEIFFDLELSPKTKPDVKPRTKRESPEAPAVPRASRSVWITQLLAEKLADFRPRGTGNPECNAQSEIYQQHLKNLTLWAMQSKCCLIVKEEI